jgi:hypothetical protein
MPENGLHSRTLLPPKSFGLGITKSIFDQTQGKCLFFSVLSLRRLPSISSTARTSGYPFGYRSTPRLLHATSRLATIIRTHRIAFRALLVSLLAR